MRTIIFLLLLAAASWAFMIKPAHFDTQDTGSESLPTMDVDMTIDCSTKDLIVNVSEGNDPIEGASAVLFYTDYGYQPLPGGGKTDSSGIVTIPVTGNIDLLTALFILRVDKAGYRSREIEFAYEKCFQEPPPEPVPYVNESGAEETAPEPPAVNETPPANVTPPEEVPPPSNISPPLNETIPEQEPPGSEAQGTDGACPLGIVMLSLLFARVMR